MGTVGYFYDKGFILCVVIMPVINMIMVSVLIMCRTLTARAVLCRC